jgi:hypothetical protein
VPDDKKLDSERVEVYYHKSNFFRVVHADGCYGGVTPRGGLHFGFYSERGAIPLRTALPLAQGKPAGPEEVLESKPGLVRELEVDVVMDFSTAASLYVWLRGHLDTLRQVVNVSDEDWGKIVGAEE